jgi:hypothetical protein
MGNAWLPTWAEAGQAFQANSALQVLDLIDKLLADATRVSKAIFAPKYVAAILPSCYTGCQLFKQLAEFWLLLMEAQVEPLAPLF